MGKILGIILGMLIFSGIVLGITVFIGDITTNYGVSTANIGFLNKTAETAGQIEELANRTTSTLNPDEITSFNPLPAIDAIKIAGSSIDIATSLVGDISDPNSNGGVTNITIPAWFAAIVIFSIMLIVIFGILKAWLKIDA